jgi:hypothetical protein
LGEDFPPKESSRGSRELEPSWKALEASKSAFQLDDHHLQPSGVSPRGLGSEDAAPGTLRYRTYKSRTCRYGWNALSSDLSEERVFQGLCGEGFQRKGHRLTSKMVTLTALSGMPLGLSFNHRLQHNQMII